MTYLKLSRCRTKSASSSFISWTSSCLACPDKYFIFFTALVVGGILVGHAYHCRKILLSQWAMRVAVMNTWAMNIKLEVIKGYLRNITLSNTPEEKFQPPSIRLRSGPIEDHQEVDMRDSCTLNQSFARKIWHLIKSDLDITEKKSLPLTRTWEERGTFYESKEISTK